MAVDWTSLFKKHKGQWVTLEDDERTVISSDANAKAALARAKEKGYEHPILFRVPNKIMSLLG
jgi:hypothetical protein